jgi:hypothetical protein
LIVSRAGGSRFTRHRRRRVDVFDGRERAGASTAIQTVGEGRLESRKNGDF